ncbi:MAG: sulfurtransferase TusA family protein [Anaerolineae bacterium]|nr:sulfurtransferase TusA family protein [Anaerolineae bacterium]
MSEIKTFDARGLSCPQPALQAEKFLSQVGSGLVEILVDTGTSRDNVARLARKAGWSVEIETKPGEGFRLILKK